MDAYNRMQTPSAQVSFGFLPTEKAKGTPPETLWRGIGHEVPYDPTIVTDQGERVRKGRQELAEWLNEQLSDPFGLAIGVTWEDNFLPQINGGIGFARLAWYQVMGNIARGFYMGICGSCGEPFIRLEGRAPRAGKLAYCDKCRAKNYSITRRGWQKKTGE